MGNSERAEGQNFFVTVDGLAETSIVRLQVSLIRPASSSCPSRRSLTDGKY